MESDDISRTKVKLKLVNTRIKDIESKTKDSFNTFKNDISKITKSVEKFQVHKEKERKAFNDKVTDLRTIIENEVDESFDLINKNFKNLENNFNLLEKKKSDLVLLKEKTKTLKDEIVGLEKKQNLHIKDTLVKHNADIKKTLDEYNIEAEKKVELAVKLNNNYSGKLIEKFEEMEKKILSHRQFEDEVIILRTGVEEKLPEKINDLKRDITETTSGLENTRKDFTNEINSINEENLSNKLVFKENKEELSLMSQKVNELTDDVFEAKSKTNETDETVVRLNEKVKNLQSDIDYCVELKKDVVSLGKTISKTDRTLNKKIDSALSKQEKSLERMFSDQEKLLNKSLKNFGSGVTIQLKEFEKKFKLELNTISKDIKNIEKNNSK